MNSLRDIKLSTVLIAIVVGALAITMLVAVANWGSDAQKEATPQVSQKESFCSYANRTNGSGLLQLASTTDNFTDTLVIIRGYLPSAPPPVKPDVTTLVHGLSKLRSQKNLPRTVDAQTTTAAAAMDQWVAANCTKKGTTK